MTPAQHAPNIAHSEFDSIRKMLYGVCGIRLNDAKLELVRSRLLRRLRELGLASFAEYLAKVEADRTGKERSVLVDALTTNTTSFFRENHHFEFLRKELLPTWRRTHRAVRIWSAGCSSGQEPYSLAMTILDDGGPAWDAKILATDISTRVLAAARSGEYTGEALAGIPPLARSKHLEAAAEGRHKFRPSVRRLITFAGLNLKGAWPMHGPFQAIFCRNVMIYFDRDLQLELARRYSALLEPGGYLFLGHSESLQPGKTDMRGVGPSVYRRPQ